MYLFRIRLQIQIANFDGWRENQIRPVTTNDVLFQRKLQEKFNTINKKRRTPLLRFITTIFLILT